MPCAPHKPEYEYMPGAGGSPAGVGLAARGGAELTWGCVVVGRNAVIESVTGSSNRYSRIRFFIQGNTLPAPVVLWVGHGAASCHYLHLTRLCY